MSKVKVNFPRIGAPIKPAKKNDLGVTQEQVTAKATEMIQKSGMPPEMFVRIGNLCEAAILDKSKYPEYVKFMVSHRLETEESMKKPDFQLMASMVVIGKVAQTMVGQQPAQGM